MNAHIFKVHQILETPGHIHPRLYSVVGVYLGGTKQEDCIELICIDRSKPNADGKDVHRMLVPQEMLQAGIGSGLFNVTESV